ncbi:hypothetical protein CKAN_02299900 [Cinnamomum micranthum f. kanehirae]|uniref:Uncharacterized protein n=1 Tax=Cinnamomum micranthum f. kanehirae TaxID=337451 RepID=A0A3S3NEZ1_9MAGN|nr:hypothetical protein CKAN_02299900 [Cinnamomum micranthum f. kanehirae]
MTSNLGSDGVFVGVVKKKVEGCSNAEMEITDDELFRLLLIFENYVGPDLKDGKPHKSVFKEQPPYIV